MYALLVAQNSIENAILSVVLQQVGVATTTAGNLNHALETWSRRPSDLIVLAVEEGNPLEMVNRVRSETEVPLVLIVAGVEEAEHFQLLEARADLVVTRPFSARMLVAQLRALLRRAQGVQVFSLPILSLGGLTLNPSTRTVRVESNPPRALTNLAFRLLYTLMIHHGQVLPTEVIVQRVWGYKDIADTELVRGLISRVRAKIEPEPRKPRYIITVPAAGYSFESGE
ncbi:MAG: response regulator transcription factor [Chloroflexota bacterium]